MDEIVIDANIFAHALNPGNDLFESSVHVVSSLRDSKLMLALDDTGKASVESSSNLYREYMECLPYPSLSRDILTHLLSSGRVVFHRRPSREKWLKCKQLAFRNANDAIVLGIAVMANRHEVVSNDYDDFNPDVRKSARRGIGVIIYDSSEFSA